MTSLIYLKKTVIAENNTIVSLIQLIEGTYPIYGISIEQRKNTLISFLNNLGLQFYFWEWHTTAVPITCLTKKKLIYPPPIFLMFPIVNNVGTFKGYLLLLNNICFFVTILESFFFIQKRKP